MASRAGHVWNPSCTSHQAYLTVPGVCKWTQGHERLSFSTYPLSWWRFPTSRIAYGGASQSSQTSSQTIITCTSNQTTLPSPKVSEIW
jgi:hypothetical protein